MKQTVYMMNTVEDGKDYYWRVKAWNDAGESAWSDPQLFTATAPYIELTRPTGGEKFEQGLDYYLTWKDNILEDVVIQISEADPLEWMVLDTTASDGGYQWEIPLDFTVGTYVIRIRSLDNPLLADSSSEAFSIINPLNISPESRLPKVFALNQNYPNPFNPSTTIRISLPKSEYVSLKVYNILGEEIRSVVNNKLLAGDYSYVFDGSNLASGIYYYRIVAGEFQAVKKMILIK